VRLSLATLALVLGSCRNTERVSAPAPEVGTVDTAPSTVDVEAAAPRPALPEIETDWCIVDGWHGLDERNCYLVPTSFSAAPTKRLLVYLSGIVPPTRTSPQKENVQRIVAAAAARAGAVALLPRGRRGIGPADAKDWWAWPTSAGDHARHAPEMVASFLAARDVLETSLGKFDRTYLAGSSSGAYFLANLALSGAVAMDGYAAASGGAVGFGRASDGGPPRRSPFYVGWGAGDPTNGGPKALGAWLSSVGWPARTAEHPGGHGAREIYLDEAFAFWDASTTSPR
jgi:predicted esterase